jgi:hypothetical protein
MHVDTAIYAQYVFFFFKVRCISDLWDINLHVDMFGEDPTSNVYCQYWSTKLTILLCLHHCL